MGLTINHDLRSTTKNPEKLINKMRQLALDMPFQSVSEVKHCFSNGCSYHELLNQHTNEANHILYHSTSVPLPWNKNHRISCFPDEIYTFFANPGDGCESLDLTLCKFPKEIEVEYDPYQDVKYQKKGNFCWRKWLRRHPGQLSTVVETRTIKTNIPSWTSSGYCKTQYASNPAFGGLPNFLRCHLTVITLLERIAKLPTVKLQIDDEGHFGTARYSDDWREARQLNRQPTYVWHPATYDLRVLVDSVNESNQQIAAIYGALKDANFQVVSPIANFDDFEKLEFKGTQDPNVMRFINSLTPANSST